MAGWRFSRFNFSAITKRWDLVPKLASRDIKISFDTSSTSHRHTKFLPLFIFHSCSSLPRLRYTMATSSTTISDLPEELLLQLVSYFCCITSQETQTAAFKNKQQEKGRQCENRTRQLSLHALCLMSHRLRRIATPILYASFTGSTTWYNFKLLQLFHRTISSPVKSITGHIRLLDCLQYVENRSADYLGNSLDSDIHVDGADRMVAQYYTLLADVIIRAPNLRQITVVSLETSEVSLWKNIVPEEGSLSSTPKMIHRLQKLQVLCLQVHTSELVSTAGCFRRICSAVATLPMLTEFRTSGATVTTAVSSLGKEFQFAREYG